MTEWREIPGATRYEVSDNGRVRSNRKAFTTRDGRTQRGRGQELKIQSSSDGYPLVTITTDGNQRRRQVRVHILMCEAFYGPRQPGHEARHLNDDRIDNRIGNLAWGTKSQNAFDAVRNKRHRQSRKKHCPRGHAYDRVYTTVDGRPKRACSKCLKKSNAEDVA